jgi:hypothetical protein
MATPSLEQVTKVFANRRGQGLTSGRVSGPEQAAGPRAGRTHVFQADVAALVIGLPELDRLGGQHVQGPARRDQSGVRVDFGLGAAEGLVEFGRTGQRLGLAADQRRGPGRGRPCRGQ